MDLVLMRHPPIHVADGVCYGALDLRLKRHADEEAQVLADKWLALALPAPRIFTSPLLRCADTAHALAARLNAEWAIEPRLAELHFGNWEGVAWSDVPRSEIDAWAANLMHAKPHGGESVAELALRVDEWLMTVAQQEDPGQAFLPRRSDSDWFSGPIDGNALSDHLQAGHITPMRRQARFSPPECAPAVSDANERRGPDFLPATASMRPCIVVSHAGVIRVMAALILQLAVATCSTWPLSMPGLCHLRRGANGEWRLMAWNV